MSCVFPTIQPSHPSIMTIPPLRTLLSAPSVADVALKLFTVIATVIIVLKLLQVVASLGYRYIATFSVALVTSLLVSLYIHVADDHGAHAFVERMYIEHGRLLSFVSWWYI